MIVQCERRDIYGEKNFEYDTEGIDKFIEGRDY